MQTLSNIVIDFYRNNYVQVIAKQYDHLARKINITLCNKGDKYFVDSTSMIANIKYTMPSGTTCLDNATINSDGTVSFELSNLHLSEAGDAHVDVVIFDKSNPDENGDLKRLTSVEFDVHILSSNYKDTEAEILKSDQFSALTKLYESFSSNVDNIIEQTKEYSNDSEAWAIGKRNGEAVKVEDETHNNNAQYYSVQSSKYSEAAAASSVASENYKNQSKEQADRSEGYVDDAEAWAIGERDKDPVSESDITYNNNSKYYASQSEVYASEAKIINESVKKTYEDLTKQTGGIIFYLDSETGALSFEGDYDFKIDINQETGEGTGYIMYYHK